MSRWGEYVDLHQIDEMVETPQETIKNPLPGERFFLFTISVISQKCYLKLEYIIDIAGHKILAYGFSSNLIVSFS